MGVSLILNPNNLANLEDILQIWAGEAEGCLEEEDVSDLVVALVAAVAAVVVVVAVAAVAAVWNPPEETPTPNQELRIKNEKWCNRIKLWVGISNVANQSVLWYVYGQKAKPRSTR